jgi:hypothetical protein
MPFSWLPWCRVMVVAVQEAVQDIAPQPFKTADVCLFTLPYPIPQTGGYYSHDHASSGCPARASYIPGAAVVSVQEVGPKHPTSRSRTALHIANIDQASSIT